MGDVILDVILILCLLGDIGWTTWVRRRMQKLEDHLAELERSE